MADSDTDYRLERLTPERLPDLVALHAATYGPGLTLDDARRKFSTATLGHDVIGYLAYDRAGTAAAYYGIFPMRVRLGDRDLLAGQSGDTMTHPDHRGRGLFGIENVMLPNPHHCQPNGDGSHNLQNLNRLKPIKTQMSKDSPCDK